MLLADIALGALITFVEPGTTTGICGKVVYLGEGAGGVPTVWAIQAGSNRGIKAPAVDVRPGCAAVPSAVSSPGNASPPVPPAPPAPSTTAVKS